MAKYPEGKGVMVWNLDVCAGGNPNTLAAKAKAAGFSWVALKVQDGPYVFARNRDRLAPTIKALREVGIKAWGWGYLRGANVLKQSIAAVEAAATVKLLKDYLLEGFLIDVESEYKRQPKNRDWASTYMTALRTSLPKVPLGLCSYRWPSYHPELPWREFLAYCDFHAPQVYWQNAHNPAAQLTRCVRELTALKALPIIPAGSAYSEHGWQPSILELNEFDAEAQRLKLPGVTWWSFEHAERIPGFWTTLASHKWQEATQPTPAPVPVPPPTAPGPGWKDSIDAWARTKGYDGPKP